MTRTLRYVGGVLLLTACVGLVCCVRETQAYVEAPHSLGQIVALSTHVVVMRVEKVDKEKNLIIYRKVRDLKGTHPTQEIKHNIGRGGFHPREWQYPMEWAEAGKTAIFFHNGGASETCIGNYWYQAYPSGEWWGMSHGEPFLLRAFAGNLDKLAHAVTEIHAGRETVVSCMENNLPDLHLRRAKVMRVKASLKLDYNIKRDFVGWGGEDFTRVGGMAGFTHICKLTRVDPDAQSLAALDIDADGKADLCVGGSGRVALLQNGGESLNELSLPTPVTGSRAAVWADYNGDHLPDLLVATPTGPKLFTNLGKGAFRDDTHLLPFEPGYNLTCAAWIDHDGDGRPDVLLGNGYHGLRLYRNLGAADLAQAPLRLGPWHHCGPFPNPNRQGFAAVYPPEQGVNLMAKFGGKNNEPAEWRAGAFVDGQVNNLALFQPANNVDAVVYLTREIECAKAMELPISLGSDDGLVVWLNGQKVLSENVDRACAPDQNRVTLKLNAGKNRLLLKVCQGFGEWSFYFKTLIDAPPVVTWKFADVSDAAGLGERGLGGAIKGDTLTVCDVNGDGKPDFLYGAGTGLLALNTGKGFIEAKDSGITYQPGHIGPVFGDFDGDGQPDLVIPQAAGVKLFHNDGKGKFTDATVKSGLSSFACHATCAAWGDVDNDGKLDLVVGCLNGPNRVFRNKGDGGFEDATAAFGLEHRIYNTQAVLLVDLNGDGVLDFVFNNEGQEPIVLLGNPEFVAKRTPVTLQVKGKGGVVGSKVVVRDGAGKVQASHHVSGGDGRGSQAPPAARFALAPGTYKVEVQYTTGIRRGKEINVTSAQVRDVIDDTATAIE